MEEKKRAWKIPRVQTLTSPGPTAESVQNPGVHTFPRSGGKVVRTPSTIYTITLHHKTKEHQTNQQSRAAGSLLKLPADEPTAGRCAAQAESLRPLRGGSGGTSWKQRAGKQDLNTPNFTHRHWWGWWVENRGSNTPFVTGSLYGCLDKTEREKQISSYFNMECNNIVFAAVRLLAKRVRIWLQRQPPRAAFDVLIYLFICFWKIKLWTAGWFIMFDLVSSPSNRPWRRSGWMHYLCNH